MILRRKLFDIEGDLKGICERSRSNLNRAAGCERSRLTILSYSFLSTDAALTHRRPILKGYAVFPQSPIDAIVEMNETSLLPTSIPTDHVSAHAPCMTSSPASR